MKVLILIISFSFSSAWAVCSLPIIRTSAGANTVLTSTRYNSDVNTAYNRVNNLPGDCVIDSSVTTSKIANNAVTTIKIADGAITASKLAANALPEIGRLLRVRAFTANGTWTLGSDVGSVFVQVVGGGGGAYFSGAGATNGGTSTFGGHCIGYGGLAATVGGSGAPGGQGGTGENGDINIQGSAGDFASDTGHGAGGHGGVSMLGHFGQGGNAGTASNGGGGGAGGYCAKLIKRDLLNSSEVINVGAGGTSPASYATPGKSGLVLIYEYSK